MPTAEAFLQAILADPDADGPRLVYADWLDEQGDAARAEFIRTQIALTHMGADDERRPGLEDREWELLNANQDAWLGKMCEAFTDDYQLYTTHTVRSARRLHSYRYLRGVRFERGLVEGVISTGPPFVACAPKLFRRWPVRRVEVVYVTREVAASLLRMPGLERLTKLDLFVDEADGLGPPLVDPGILVRLKDLGIQSGVNGPKDMAPLPVFPFRGLERLRLRGVRMRAAGAQLLADWPGLAGLRKLDLPNNALGDAGVGILYASRHLGRLTALDVSGNNLGGHGARVLARAERLRELTDLDVSNNPLKDEGVEELARSPHLRRLRKLSLRLTEFGRAGIRALARSPNLEGVTDLDLGFNEFGPEGLAELVGSPVVSSLETLKVSGRGTDGVPRALANSPYLRNLKSLRLDFEMPRNCDIRALTESPYLTNLCELVCQGVGLDDQAARALAAWPGLARMGLVDLTYNRIGDAGALALAASPYAVAGVTVILSVNRFSEQVRAALRNAGPATFIV